MEPVTPVQAKELLIDCVSSNLVPMISGSPGVGKSSVVRQIADEFNLKVIDMRLSQCDPTDLNGFPVVDSKTDKASYRPMDTFPLETDALPLDSEGKPMGGWMLFLDEFNSAPLSVQAAAYKLVLDRAIGQHKLHPQCAIICAGNKSTDGAIVNRMSTAMQSRLIHLEMGVDHKSWLLWAAEAQIDYRVTSYINFKPGALNLFNPDHSDQTFACQRTWEFVSKLISKWPTTISRSKTPLLSGTIGEGAAREFLTFCEIFKDLVSIDQIIKNPMGVNVPVEPSTQFALSGSIANNANEKNIGPLMDFVNRLPLEFQVITIQDILKRKRELVSNEAISSWVTTNAKALF